MIDDIIFRHSLNDLVHHWKSEARMGIKMESFVWAERLEEWARAKAADLRELAQIVDDAPVLIETIANSIWPEDE